MLDGHLMLAERLAKEHVLVAIVVEVLVEGIAQDDITVHHEVGGAKLLVASFSTGVRTVGRFAVLFVAIAQVVAPSLGVATDGYTTYDDEGCCVCRCTTATYGIQGNSLGIAFDEVGVAEGEVAINEDEPGILGFTGQQVADSRAPHVMVLHEIPHMAELFYLFVSLNKRSVGRTIIGHNDLEGDALWFALPVQGPHKVYTQAVVCGEEYRKPFFHLFTIFGLVYFSIRNSASLLTA